MNEKIKDLETGIQEYKDENEELTKRVQELESEVRYLENEISDLEKDVRDLENEVTDLESKLVDNDVIDYIKELDKDLNFRVRSHNRTLEQVAYDLEKMIKE
jgi:chromosome segregation ATPase